VTGTDSSIHVPVVAFVALVFGCVLGTLWALGAATLVVRQQMMYRRALRTHQGRRGT
jgi:predicted membrane protein